MAKAERHKWEFRARFRRRAFGWRSQPAIKRVKEAVSEIKKAFRLIYESGYNISQAAKEIKKRLRPLPEIEELGSFLEEESKRGISKKTALEKEAEELVLPEIPELGI